MADTGANPPGVRWRLHRYADVAQALRDPRLVLPGQTGFDPAAHLQVREAMVRALSAERLAAWRAPMVAHAHGLIDRFVGPGGHAGGHDDPMRVDLVGAFAQPWSLALALRVTGAPREHAAECDALARRLFRASAVATSAQPSAEALSAAPELARCLALGAADTAGTAFADVQTFVALSQSLPALLGGAWWALLRQPPVLAAILGASAPLAPGAVNELIRLGTPARAVFREAAETLVIGGIAMQRGDGVALMLGEANLDVEHFADPQRLDPARAMVAGRPAGHLGLGGGPHACAGAALVRMALAWATEVLIERSGSLALADDAQVEWLHGFAMRAPLALPVRWQARQV